MNEPDDVFEWKEMPAATRAPRDTKIRRRLEKLKERPGESAVIFVSKSKKAVSAKGTQLRKEANRRPAGRFEIEARGFELYGRYLGPEETVIE